MPEGKLSLFSQQYRDIRGKINRKLLKRFDAPWMKTKEYDILLEIIENVQPKNCLEWGSGYSTLLIPETISGLESWHSIEHDSQWFNEISEKVSHEKVTVHLAEPDNANFAEGETKLTEKKDGLYEDFKSYVDLPQSLGISFDYIFIDGRARRSCLIKAHDLLADDGVIIVHDANRDIYFEDIPEFANSVRFTDYRKKRKLGGIWIGRKNGKVSDVLDIDLHNKLWRRNDTLAKSLFLK